jgi:hypothetical protein
MGSILQRFLKKTKERKEDHSLKTVIAQTKNGVVHSILHF